jgi:hypothetical protein
MHNIQKYLLGNLLMVDSSKFPVMAGLTIRIAFVVLFLITYGDDKITPDERCLSICAAKSPMLIGFLTKQ